MIRHTAVILAAAVALASCGRRQAPPTPEALGAELASFPQVLLPLTQDAYKRYTNLAEKPNPETAGGRQLYTHGSATVAGKPVALFLAYSGPWQAPKGLVLQPVSVLQFLRAFTADSQTDIAAVAAPKGSLYFTRAQLPDIVVAAKAAGASDADIPFGFIIGSGR